MSQLSGAKIGSRAVRCGWAHHKKDAMQSIDYTTVDQARYLQLFAAALLASAPGMRQPLPSGSSRLPASAWLLLCMQICADQTAIVLAVDHLSLCVFAGGSAERKRVHRQHFP